MRSRWSASSDPIANIERSLRNLIHDELACRFGVEWHRDTNAGLGSVWAQGLDERLQEDEKALSGRVALELPIAYSEFRDLVDLLDKHKEIFAPILGNWTTAHMYIERVAGLRNAAKHHRELAPSQLALLEGISGEIDDAVSNWYVGVRAAVVETEFQVTELVATDDRTDREVIDEVKAVVLALVERFEEAFVTAGLPREKVQRCEESAFRIRTGTSQDVVSVVTSDSPHPTSRIDDRNYRQVTATFCHKCGSSLRLERVMEPLGLPYRLVSYVLEKSIDAERLREACGRRAGLTPSSSGSRDGVLASVEYSFLSGEIRIGASRGNAKGRGSVSLNAGVNGLMAAHSYMPAPRLLGILLGDITPKTLLYLVSLSKEGQKRDLVLRRSHET